MIQLLPAVLALAAFAYAVADNAPVQIALEGPRVQFEPATIRLRIRILPHASNRGLTVAAISEGFARSSWEDLPGANAPITRWVEYRYVPAGHYTIQVILARSDGTARNSNDSLIVLGR